MLFLVTGYNVCMHIIYFQLLLLTCFLTYFPHTVHFSFTFVLLSCLIQQDEQYASKVQQQLWAEVSSAVETSTDLLSTETTHLVRYVL